MAQAGFDPETNQIPPEPRKSVGGISAFGKLVGILPKGIAVLGAGLVILIEDVFKGFETETDCDRTKSQGVNSYKCRIQDFKRTR